MSAFGVKAAGAIGAKAASVAGKAVKGAKKAPKAAVKEAPKKAPEPRSPWNTRFGAGGGLGLGGYETYGQLTDDEAGVDLSDILTKTGMGILGGLGLRSVLPIGRAAISGTGAAGRALRNPWVLGGVGASAIAGPALYGMKFGEEPAAAPKAPLNMGELLGGGAAGAVAAGANPWDIAASQISGNAAMIDGSSVPPDYFSYMNDPQIQALVAADIASMQSPLRRSVKQRKLLRREGEAATRAGMEEFRRTSKNLRKEARTAADEYQVGSANRALEQEDAMGRVADRLLGSSVSTGVLDTERRSEAAEDIIRRQKDVGIEVEKGSNLMQSSADFMGDMAALEEMESERDIRDSRRQMGSDVMDINAQMNDLASQAPALRQKYGAALADYEMQKYKLAADAAAATQGDINKLMIEQAKADATGAGGGGGKPGDYSIYLKRARERSSPINALMDKETDEQIGTWKDFDVIANDPRLARALQMAYNGGGDMAGDRLINAINTALGQDYTPDQIAEGLGV